MLSHIGGKKQSVLPCSLPTNRTKTHKTNDVTHVGEKQSELTSNQAKVQTIAENHATLPKNLYSNNWSNSRQWILCQPLWPEHKPNQIYLTDIDCKIVLCVFFCPHTRIQATMSTWMFATISNHCFPLFQTSFCHNTRPQFNTNCFPQYQNLMFSTIPNECLPQYQITVDCHPDQIAVKAIKSCKTYNTWRPPSHGFISECILWYAF